MASLSPSGKSAVVTTRPEKYFLGSGVYFRTFASLEVRSESRTHCGITMAMLATASAAEYLEKSEVAEMI